LDCFVILDRAHDSLYSVGCDFVQHSTVDDATKQVVLASIEFGCDTLQAVKLELERKRVVQAAVLVRPLFELAIRNAWASMKKDGWKILRRWWLKEEEKWAKDAYKTSELRGHADWVLHEVQREMAGLSGMKLAPSLEAMVQDMHRTGNESDPGRFIYTCYRELSQFAHANYRWLGGGIRNAAVAQHIVIVGVWAELCVAVPAVELLGKDTKKHYKLADKLFRACSSAAFACFGTQ